MPLTDKGKKILANMKKQYGNKRGQNIFYASANKGTITGVEPGGRIRRTRKKTKKLVLEKLTSRIGGY